MENGVLFPVAETFVSPQGEGLFTGTMMQFVRLAGCSVGKPYNQVERVQLNILNSYQTKCATFDGREFTCDTNYQMKTSMTKKGIADLAMQHSLKRICLTGGEPLMHEGIIPAIHWLASRGFTVHVETSGTIPLVRIFNPKRVWITVSPKRGYLPSEIRENANEIKLLVDENFTDEVLKQFMTSVFPEGAKDFSPTVWLQPINNEYNINYANVKLCLAMMDRYRTLRLSLQQHKVIGVR